MYYEENEDLGSGFEALDVLMGFAPDSGFDEPSGLEYAQNYESDIFGDFDDHEQANVQTFRITSGSTTRFRQHQNDEDSDELLEEKEENSFAEIYQRNKRMEQSRSPYPASYYSEEEDDHDDEEMQYVEILKEMFLERKDGLAIEEDLLCPLSIHAKWRRTSGHPAREYEEFLPECRGKAKGFNDLGGLYQHVQKQGGQCSFHNALEQKMKLYYGEHISHVRSVKKKAHVRPLKRFYRGSGIDTVGTILKELGPPSADVTIVWPAFVFLSGLPMKGCESKNSLLRKFERFGVDKAAPLYTRSQKGPVFTGRACIRFPANSKGFANALHLIYVVNDEDRRREPDEQLSRASALLGTRKELRYAENYLSYKKLIRGWRMDSYRLRVWDPYLTKKKAAEGNFDEDGWLDDNSD